MSETCAAQIISGHQNNIIESWEAEIRKNIQAASQEHQSVLINTLPIFIESLIKAIETNDVGKLAVDGSTVAGDHGSERARLTNFTPESIIEEYKILRRILFDLLDKTDALTPQVRRIIFESIEDVTLLSLKGFFETYAKVREEVTITLSHDVRNPLASIRAAADLLDRSSFDPDKVHTLAHKIRKASSRIDQMVQTFLDSSRLKVVKNSA